MKDKIETLPVSEQFLSIQGEGSTMGKPSYFLRLKSCNLMCGGKGTEKDGLLHDGAKWRCDTIEVWLKGKSKTYADIRRDYGVNYMKNLEKGYHLIITGGEPLLHQEAIVNYIKSLNNYLGQRVIVEIETNGTIVPDKDLTDLVAIYNVSPKLSNSGMPAKKRIKALALMYFNGLRNSIFKFVINDQEDFLEVSKLIDMEALSADKIWLMPAADNDNDLQKVSQFVAAKCIQHGYNFSSRLHVGIWNKKTGV